ncbi:hypothetical protein IAD21_04132 [Abditibacteriota bacterium]|nr:hypothetical protein IAD21_04132 [Abditibacteriota bacterium]
MPHTSTHRGPHPRDAELFAPDKVPMLREAVADLSLLLERGYASRSALELVGNHFQLHERQRLGVMRCSCGDATLDLRLNKEATSVRNHTLHLDGYNIIMLVEAALGGGVILRARDGSLRDMASEHGNFRRVEETGPALELIAQVLDELRVNDCVWWLDSPISNSGRLRALILEIAAKAGREWRAELVPSADVALKKLPDDVIVATADSAILDAVSHWFNFGNVLIESHVPGAWLVDLSV